MQRIFAGRRLAWLTAFAVILLAAPAAQAESVSSLKNKFKKAVNQGNLAAAIQIGEKFFELETSSAIDAFFNLALAPDWVEIDRMILVKTKKMGDGPAFQRMCELANEHKDHRVRTLLTTGLAKRSEKEAYTAVLQNLFDRERPVVMASIEALRKRDTLSSVNHLIRALQHYEERGRVAKAYTFEIRRLLYDLTLEDFPIAADWRNWWAVNEGSYERPKNKKKKDGGGTVVVKDEPEIWGTEIVSRNILFVLDVSGSMTKRDPLPEEPGDGGGKSKGANTGVVKKGKKKEDEEEEELPESRMRLKRVQNELIRVLEELKPDVKFNILTFCHELEWLQKGGLMPANRKNKRNATNFVRNFTAEGETHTDEALQAAFKLKNVDVIFLLSDGMPRRDGERLDEKPIVDWVKVNNRYRRVKINTIGFAQAASRLRKFLKRIASSTGGEYSEVK